MSIEQEISKLYNILVPDDDDVNWTEVDDNVILQPETTANGDKYIVWLKEVTSDEKVIKDVQFLESTYEKEIGQEEMTVIQEVVRIPVTYDSVALFVILGIILVAILVVGVMKWTLNKKEKNK